MTAFILAGLIAVFFIAAAVGLRAGNDFTKDPEKIALGGVVLAALVAGTHWLGW